MCGIAGFVGAGDENILSRMTDALRHRGPDGDGFFIESQNRVFLGHRRLAVVDLEGGKQPMTNRRGDIQVIYNGEIYNHRNLRAELVGLGYAFQTDHSDTEVLVHGYDAWQDDLPRRLNGMFAFAIYDSRRRRLFLARDRFGEKPLFIAETPNGFAFASEIKSLILHPDVDKSFSKLSLQKFFAYGYFPTPHTPFTSVRKMPPGSWLSLDVKDLSIRKNRYWELSIEPSAPPTPAEERALVEELRHLLRQSVKRRLESDVPLGVFLSGGIDSTMIATWISHETDAHLLNSFSIGFEEPSFDETRFAEFASEAIGTTHHTLILDRAMARNTLLDLMKRLDEPVGDPAILPTYLVSKLASEHVTVALSGDGGDELFAGYDQFPILKWAQVYDKAVPTILHHLIKRSSLKFVYGAEHNMSLGFKVRRALRGLSHPPPAWNPSWLGPMALEEIGDLFDDQITVEELYSEAFEVWERAPSKHIVDKTLEFLTKLFLVDAGLVRVDLASMENSLEVRTPFLDNDLVEFALRLPHTMKYRNGQRKYLLKKALAGVLPDQILQRRKKGFGIPVTKWLKDIDTPSTVRPTPHIRDSWMLKSLCEHQAGRADHRGALWCWLASKSYAESIDV